MNVAILCIILSVTATISLKAQVGRIIYTTNSGQLAIAWSPQGDRLAFGGYDGILTLWDVAADSVISTIHASTGAINSIAWRPERNEIGYGSGDAIGIWNTASGAVTELHGNDKPVNCITWSPNGKLVACAGGHGRKSFRIWDAEQQQQLLALDTTFDGTGCNDNVVAWEPGGNGILAAGGCGWMGIRYDPTAGTELGHLDTWFNNESLHASIRSLTFSPDGTEFATGHFTNLINIYDAATLTIKRQVYADSDNYEHVLAWSPSGTLLADGNRDGIIRIFDARTMVLLHAFPAHYGGVTSITWSPDGKRMATCGNNFMVKIWDAETLTSSVAGPVVGESMMSIEPNPVRERLHIHFAGISPGNTTLLLTDTRGTVVLAAGHEMHGMAGEDVMMDLAGIPSGMYVLTAQLPGGRIVRRMLEVLH
ncbi:MAG TPA: WD40 repeat domain-containing protein [Candidatus Kapabacteria bacterium]|nr:WD40 repeat domain-containing protein [Candidatus Kapabacteria bacterium]